MQRIILDSFVKRVVMLINTADAAPLRVAFSRLCADQRPDHETEALAAALSLQYLPGKVLRKILTSRKEANPKSKA